jgi:hypothetical protein
MPRSFRAGDSRPAGEAARGAAPVPWAGVEQSDKRRRGKKDIMRVRTARRSLSAAVLATAGLALVTACGSQSTDSADRPPASATTSATTSADTTGGAGGSPAATGTPRTGATPAATAGATSAGTKGSSATTMSGTAHTSHAKCTDRIDYAGDPRSNAEINSIGEQTGTCPPVTTTGSGAADAGDRTTIVGRLTYLAPGKLTVTPQSGGTERAFLVSNATTILGAAAICSDTDGRVTIDSDGYGTSACSVDQLETAAKTGGVSVRVTMDTRSGGAETVAEKYHP